MIVSLCNFSAAMLVSSDAFGDAVREVYEPEWPGRDKLIQYLEVCEQFKSVKGYRDFFNYSLYNILLIIIVLFYSNKDLHNQWQELVEKLDDEVIIPLTAYQSQFPDIKVHSWLVM